jgi:16S rRNA G527 N7-methylase RsmG
MKGRRPDEELAAVAAPWRVVAVRQIEVPELHEERSLIVLERHNPPSGP